MDSALDENTLLFLQKAPFYLRSDGLCGIAYSFLEID